MERGPQSGGRDNCLPQAELATDSGLEICSSNETLSLDMSSADKVLNNQPDTPRIINPIIAGNKIP